MAVTSPETKSSELPDTIGSIADSIDPFEAANLDGENELPPSLQLVEDKPDDFDPDSLLENPPVRVQEATKPIATVAQLHTAIESDPADTASRVEDTATSSIEKSASVLSEAANSNYKGLSLIHI